MDDKPSDMKLECRLEQGFGPRRFTPESILNELGFRFFAMTEKVGKDFGSALLMPFAFTRMGVSEGVTIPRISDTIRVTRNGR